MGRHIPRDVEGSSGLLLGIQKLESKRMRMSVNMGTRETRVSMVVTPLGRSSDRPSTYDEAAEWRSTRVVRDVSDVHMAKGCRMVCAGEPRCSENLEASRGTPENIGGGSQRA